MRLKRLRVYCFIVLLFPLAAFAGAIRNNPGFAANVYGPNDDGTWPCTGPAPGPPSDCTPTTMPIGFAVNFYGNTYSNLYLNNNGNITFDQALGEFTPFGLAGTGSQIIAPFFADVDTRIGNTVTFGNDTVDGHPAFGVNWIGVGYFNTNVDKLNSFQLVLISRSDRRPGDFDIEINYNQVQWETGDESGGTDGLGGNSAVAGFSNGTGLPGTSYQFAGSGVPGEFLDSNPGGLIHGSLNTNVPGRYVIPIINLTNTVLNVPLYSQGNPGWAANTYGTSPGTIQQRGSALCCLAMALKYAGISTDPGALNTLMISHNDFIAGDNVNWDAAVRDASGDTLEFHPYAGNDFQFLTVALAGGYPVIVGVNQNAQGIPDHYVLVTGIQNGSFLINDPGQADATTLDYYNDTFVIRGYLSDPPSNIGGLDIAGDGVFDLLVVDPLARRTGYEPPSTNELSEIPQSAYFLDEIEDNDLTGEFGTNLSHQVEIYQPMFGNCDLFLDGTNAGTYHLTLRSFNTNGTSGAPLMLQGAKPSNNIVEIQVNLGVGGLTLQTFTNPYPWTATPTVGPALLTVQFNAPATDRAGNAVTNWYWNFGDSTSSTLQNPVHVYNTGAYYPSVVANDSAGAALFSIGPLINVTNGLVANGGFETGDFTDWSQSGDDTATYIVEDDPEFVHSGQFGAVLTTEGSYGFLSQNLTTAPGVTYLLSCWLDSPDGQTPNGFIVNWNGNAVFNQSNLGIIGWTNLFFLVTATSNSTPLQFAYNAQGYFGLDDISVSSAQPGISSAARSGANLVLNGNNGVAGQTYYVLASTNLSLPVAQWTPISTNLLTNNGPFTITATNAISPATLKKFIRLQLQ